MINTGNTQDANKPSPASAGSQNTHMATARLSAANTWLRDEIRRLRLTDAEREAVKWYAAYGAGDHATTLRGLLDRTRDASK